MTVGEKIRAKREAVGLSQIKLGELAGVDRKTIIQYENDRQDMKLTVAMSICDALGISLTELTEKETPYKKSEGIWKYHFYATGRWEVVKGDITCPVCGKSTRLLKGEHFEFCPRCGAKIKEAD